MKTLRITSTNKILKKLKVKRDEAKAGDKISAKMSQNAENFNAAKGNDSDAIRDQSFRGGRIVTSQIQNSMPFTINIVILWKIYLQR